MNDSSTIINLARPTSLVPRAATLDGFVDEIADASGIYLRDVEPMTMLTIRTCNSRYRVIVSRDTSVIVQGGQFFPDATPGRIDGSGFGGSLLNSSSRVAAEAPSRPSRSSAGGSEILASTSPSAKNASRRASCRPFNEQTIL